VRPFESELYNRLMSIFDIGGELRYYEPMTLNVSLTPHLEQFVHETVTSGRYQSASEVVRTALRLLEEQELEREAKLEWLRQEIQKGLDSGPSSPLDMDDIKRRARQRLPGDGSPPP